MAAPQSPHSDLRKTGIAIALGVGLLIVGGLAVIMLTRSPEKAKSAAQPSKTEPIANVPDADLTQIGMQTGQAQVQFIDRKDPRRTSGMLKWKKLQPEAAGHSRLTQPEGYIFLRDGGLVVVRSNIGRLFTPPKQSEPESGSFEGDVTLSVYETHADKTPPDPAKDKPTVTASTDSLTFVLAQGELNTREAFKIRSQQFDADGRGMKLVIDQVSEAIQLFEIAHVDRVVIRPNEGHENEGQPDEAIKAITAARGEKTKDILRHYRIIIEDTIRIAHGPRLMEADRIEAWATLVNNKLSPGAFGRLGPDPAADVKPTADSAEQPALISSLAYDEPIVAAWQGALTIKPIAEFPEKDFPKNQVALKLLAGRNGPVHVSDPEIRLDAMAPQVDYAATTRDIAFRGTVPEPVRVTTPAMGTLSAKSAKINLVTGAAELHGPGTVVPELAQKDHTPDATDTPPVTLSFSDRLKLQFASERSWMTPTVLAAGITGGLVAESGEIKAKGDSADVVFSKQRDGQGRAIVEKLLLTGHAEASAPGKSFADGQPTRDVIRGDQMTVNFVTNAQTGREEPTAVEVAGNTSATSGPLTIKSKSMKGVLAKDDQGRLLIAKAIAEGEAQATDGKGLSAKADRIEAEPGAGRAMLFGAPVSIYRDGATMTGQTVRLTANSGELFVDGPGNIKSLRETEEHVPMYLETSWTHSMTFTNSTGIAECLGNSATTMTVGEDERNTVKGERMILTFPASDKVQANSSRELISAEARGTNGAPATLEHRRYATVRNERVTERLVYLQSERIFADQVKRSLTVPTPGKLLIDDRRQLAAATDNANLTSPIGQLTNTRGTSLFNWSTSLDMSLPRSTIDMRGNVSLIHQPAEIPGTPAKLPLSMECQQLLAALSTNQQNPTSLDNLQAALQRVEARDGVHVTSDGKELWTSTLIFDASRSLLEATGTEAELVTLQDPKQQAPLRARQIIWNQLDGQIRLIDPAPTMISR